MEKEEFANRKKRLDCNHLFIRIYAYLRFPIAINMEREQINAPYRSILRDKENHCQ